MTPDLRTQAVAALAAIAVAMALCAVALVRAVHVASPPRGDSPRLMPTEETRRAATLTEQQVLAAMDADPFQTIALENQGAEPKTAAAVQPEIPQPSIKLVGVALLPAGGLALIESATGSRVLRIGQTLEGLTL